MPVPLDLVGQLHALALGSDRTAGLTADLDAFLLLVIRAVPACLAVSLTTTRHGLPVTVTVLAPEALLERARASLAVPLHDRGTAGDTAHSPVLVLYASAVLAFDQLAADLPRLFGGDRPAALVLLNQEQALPAMAISTDALAGRLQQASAVDQALGVLLDRGLLLADGRVELDRRARAAGVGLLEVARDLLGEVDGRPRDVQRSVGPGFCGQA